MSQYTPFNLAYVSYDPVGGVDETLSPIIFLHGATGSKEMWCEVSQTVADKTKRKAYAVDARNHGDSKWTDEFNFDINTDDLFHFMDTVSVPKAVLVGHSMGGTTAIKAALRKPERVEMVFVEDMYVKKPSQEVLDFVVGCGQRFGEAISMLPVNCPEEDIIPEIMKLIADKIPEAAKALFNPESMSKIKFPLRKDDNGRYVFKSNVDIIMKAMKNANTLMSEPKGLYEGPSYFIYGTISPFKIYEDKENILKFFPNAELIPVENADHSIHLQFPEHFIDIVVKSILKH